MDRDSAGIAYAVVMTCHNRAQLTSRLLQKLDFGVHNATFNVVVLDDGSTDGTSSAVLSVSPHAEVVDGTGQLFWAGGMRAALEVALRRAPDVLIMLNDDLIPADGLLARVDSHIRELKSDRFCLVGQVVSEETGDVIYGGRMRVPGRPLAFSLSTAFGEQVDSFNANFVVVDRDSFIEAGGFPKGYRHGYADLVLGVRLAAVGTIPRTLPFAVGASDSNPKTGAMFDPGVPLRKRVRRAVSVFGLPIRDQFRFSVELAGLLRAIPWFVRSYARVIWPSR